MEYMVTGHIPDISPKHFLLVQLKKSLRKLWDTSLREMTDCEITFSSFQSPSPTISSISLSDPPTALSTPSVKLQVTRDKVYFRSKWPWPLKDRDYWLHRR